MKNIVIASVVLSVLGLGTSSLWADVATPTSKPANSHLVRHFEKIGLNLTDAQIVKLNDIAKATHAGVKGVLTADQQKILADAKGKGKEAHMAAWKQVHASLTADQKTKLQELRKASRLEIKAVLTADQLAKVEACRKEHHKGTSAPAPTPSTPAPAPAPAT